MSMNYVWEKFFAAVLTLATGQGNIQKRLGDAYISAVIYLKPDNLPEEMQSDFKTLQEELTRVEAVGDEGRVKATVRAMSAEKAAKLAEKIVEMYDGVAKRDPLNEYH